MRRNFFVARVYSDKEKEEYLAEYHESGMSKASFREKKIFQQQHFEGG